MPECRKLIPRAAPPEGLSLQEVCAPALPPTQGRTSPNDTSQQRGGQGWGAFGRLQSLTAALRSLANRLPSTQVFYGGTSREDGRIESRGGVERRGSNEPCHADENAVERKEVQG